MDALKFNAYDVWHRKQWYRMLSYGLVHGSWGHLFFNMLTLYFFGTVVERYFQAAFPLVCRPDIFGHFLGQLGL